MVRIHDLSRALYLASSLAPFPLILTAPAFADGTSGHGGDHDHSAKDHESDGSGENDVGSSGKLSGSESQGSDTEKAYSGGWLERIVKGRYQLFDPAGRKVIDRRATSSDRTRFVN